MNTTTAMTHPAKLYLWTRPGNTPLTGRGESFCDLLAEITVEVTDHIDARHKLAELAENYPDAEKGSFYIPSLPNQNLRTDWRSGSKLRNVG